MIPITCANTSSMSSMPLVNMMIPKEDLIYVTLLNEDAF